MRESPTEAKTIEVPQKTAATTVVTGSETPSTAYTTETRGGATAVATRPLLFWENMVCGAVSRSIAQTVMHPANTMKTILQASRGPNQPTLKDLFRPSMFRPLTRGAGANFVLSIPHGAVNFAVLEFVRGRLNTVVEASKCEGEAEPRTEECNPRECPGKDNWCMALSFVCNSTHFAAYFLGILKTTT